jgi:peptidoglycan/LPS O-acetylase OafA/YrhL
MKGGYVGVDCFFVLSGFLITGLLLSGVNKRGHVSFVDFYIRRAKRILPAATLTLVVTMGAAYYLLNEVRAKQAIWDSVYASFFTANIRFAREATDYFAQGQPPSPIQHYWSLSLEEQFYFVWPALLAVTLFGLSLGARRSSHGSFGLSTWAMRRVFVVLVLAGAASLAWSVYYTHHEPTAAYFSTSARVWELALGSALAVGASSLARIPSVARTGMGWIGLIALLAASVMYSSTTEFPGYAALLPTLGTALVIAAGIGGVSRLAVGAQLSRAPLRYVGDRSYALYLWHWPVLTIGILYAGHDLSVAAKLLLILGAFALSVISYALIENPIRRARWGTSASAILVPVSAAAVAVVAIVTLGSIGAKILREENATGAEARAAVMQPTVVKATRASSLPTVIAAVKAARRGARIPSGLTPPVSQLQSPKYLYDFPGDCVPRTDSQTTSDICHLGVADSTKSIVVFGDSHAQMWMPAILAMAEQDGWAVIPLVKSGCVPSTWLDKGYNGTKANIIRQCHTWYRWASSQVTALRPDVLMTSGCCSTANGPTEAFTKHGYMSLVSIGKRVSKSVIVLADDPGVDKQPVDCLLARHATMKTCTTTLNPELTVLNSDLAALASRKGFNFLNTKGWFCYASQCPMVVGRTIVYRDTGHVTLPYMLQLAAPFRSAFRRCVFDVCPR